MVPSLEEPIQVDLSAPLKAAPKLVAPEPGKTIHFPPLLPPHTLPIRLPIFILSP